MSDEVIEVVEAVATVPDQELPAEPEAVETDPPGSEEAEPEKVYNQAEVDAFLTKRLAKHERKRAREQAQAEVPKPINVEGLTADDFDSVEDYVEALSEHKAQEKVAKRDTAKQQSAVLDNYHSKVEDAIEKYDDFEQVAYNQNLPITDVMAQAIQSSDIGPDLIYSLGSNPKEAARISQLPEILQAKEIGRIEASLAQNPPTKKVSTAPAPINPVTARGNGSQAFDTTDPRSIDSMSTSEWIAKDRQRQEKKMRGT